MDIEVKFDPQYTVPKVMVLTDRLTEEINALVARLSEETPQLIAGFQGDILRLIEPQELLRVYSSDKKVIAVTADGEFILRQRLYEIEERLVGTKLVRISNSEIINMAKVRSFDLSIAGTICATLFDSTKAYVSRRYVTRIKKILGI